MNAQSALADGPPVRDSNGWRGFDGLGELLTTCVAIAPELVPRLFCEHVEVETLNETCQSRASSDHLPHEPQASTPRERTTLRSAR